MAVRTRNNGTLKRRLSLTKAEESARALNKAGDEAIAERYSAYLRDEVPGPDTLQESGKVEAFAKARRLANEHYWLMPYFGLKFDIVNYGLHLMPALLKGKKKKGDRERLDAWLNDAMPVPDFAGSRELGFPNQAIVKRGERILKFIDESIREYLILENCIALWFGTGTYPVVLPPERCRYKDVLGVETLFFRHGLGKREIEQLPADQQQRFSSNAELAIGEEEGEFFKVIKNERTGFGLSWPRVRSIFRVASTTDSMEFGESAYAWSARAKVRHHKVGHAITSGDHAGKPDHFLKKPRADAVHRVFDNKGGSLGDYVGNFDHEITYPFEPIEYYDEKKWSSPEHRLVIWGGPIAAMLIAKGQTPLGGLMKLLKAETLGLRSRLKIFLESVINQAFKPKPEISIGWSNMIFNEATLEAKLLQFGVSCGAVSQETFREEAGFDNAREEDRKEAEAAEFEANPQKFKPAYDPAHGDPNDGDAEGGRPPGTKDNAA